MTRVVPRLTGMGLCGAVQTDWGIPQSGPAYDLLNLGKNLPINTREHRPAPNILRSFLDVRSPALEYSPAVPDFPEVSAGLAGSFALPVHVTNLSQASDWVSYDPHEKQSNAIQGYW